MNNQEFITKSERETQEIAKHLIAYNFDKLAKGPLIIGLEGEYGSGKTTFVKGLAKALGVKKVVRSPSFVIVSEYPFELKGIHGKLIHADLWRIENENEYRQLKLEKEMIRGNVVAIEWAEKAEKSLPANTTQLVFKHIENNKRKLILK